MKHFGELLKEHRINRNMTQQEIADRLGLSSPYIAQMESGFKPPPPQLLVEKMTLIMQLSYEERRDFIESAEKERELQSLVKATRKVGHILAGNKVCTPQRSVSNRIRQEIDDIMDAIPRNLHFSIDLSSLGFTSSRGFNQSLNNVEEIKEWMLKEFGEKPAVWLVFLGIMYEVLILTPDERLLCRQPSEKRSTLIDNANNIKSFVQLLGNSVKEAKDMADEQKLPNVIAPHEAWRNIDEALGNESRAIVETIPKQMENGDSILNIPIVGIIQPGTDEFEEDDAPGFIGLPKDWFSIDKEYEACQILTDSYVNLGVWPGCKAVYELEGRIENEDLVIVRLGDRRCIRKYFDFGEEIMLQGGPLSRPERILKNDPSLRIIGVIRDLISRFSEMRKKSY